MNTRQQRTRRQARERVAWRKDDIRGVIPVKLEYADGTAVEQVAVFVYLEMGTPRRRSGGGLEWPVLCLSHWAKCGIEAEVGIVPVAGGVCVAVQCRELAHA